MSYEEIRYDVSDPVATITLDRPASLNAWTPLMGAEIDDALVRAAADPAVVGIVITGAGRGFCAGADMSVLAGTETGAGPRPASPRAGDRSWGDDFGGAFTSILSVPKPTVAAINGPVAGMAIAITLACDLRFMSPGAKFTTSFAQRGLVAEWGTSWLLPRLVGPATALDLLFSARVIGGEEAFRLGLVNRVVWDAPVADAAAAYVRDLAARCSPASMAVIKRQVYQQLHAGLGAAEREARALMEASFAHADFTEGVASFMERRPPQFARLGAVAADTAR